MGDYRWLYFLQRHPDDSVTVVLAVRVYFAYRKEQALHHMFSASRFNWTKDIKYDRWLGQGHFKIGIATNLKSRLTAINKDTSSGFTEWFALNPVEQACVLGWMRWYKIRPYANAAAITTALLSAAILWVAETL